MGDTGFSSVSRRGLVLGGLAGLAGAAAIPLARSATAATTLQNLTSGTLPLVKPLSSQLVYDAFGICSHPSFGQSGYRYTKEWMAALASIGASYFRGMYAHELTATRTTTTLARDHGIKWGMLVCPDVFYSDQELVRRIQHLAQNAADVCVYIEGVNEPNSGPEGGSPPADWPKRTVAKQKVIWQTVKGNPRLAHVKVIGPSLHAVAGTEAHYRALRDAGIVRYMDYAGMHRYPGGRYPNYLLDQRLAWVDRYWGGKPVWITETGYTNALHRSTGHTPVPEDVSAVYAPSALLEAVDRACKVSWYELLDDPDPWAQDTESNFGMYATAVDDAPPWRAKPVVAVMKALLAQLKDPGGAYDPPRVRLKVTTDATDVRTTVVAKRNGTTTLHVRRATNCWDPAASQRIAVTPVPVIVETARATLTLAVNHKVQSILI